MKRSVLTAVWATIFFAAGCYYSLSAPKRLYEGTPLPESKVARLYEQHPELQISALNGKSITELIKSYSNGSRSEGVDDMLHILPGEYVVEAAGRSWEYAGMTTVRINGHWTLRFTADAGRIYGLGYDEGKGSGGFLSDTSRSPIYVWIKDMDSGEIVSEEVADSPN